MIEFQNVSKSFDCGASWERLFAPLTVQALDDVSFQCPLDEPLVVHGPSGSGKSVLLNLMAGAYPPDEGTVRLNSVDPWENNQYQQSVSLVRPGPDDFDPSLSSRKNLRIIGGLHDLPSPELVDRVNEALDFVGIDRDEQTVPTGELSNGTQSLISLASSLITTPEVLLLDEPDRFMDPGMFDRELELIQGLINEGISVVLATPAPDRYRALSGNRLELSEGSAAWSAQP